MEDWISFLFFAGFFYIMMRYGCGAHMIHGHGKDKNHEDNLEHEYTDPVCGMKVNSDVGYGKMHEGVLYRFCSRKCLDTFESKPDEYRKISRDGEEK